MGINKFDVYEEIYLGLCSKADMLYELKYFEERKYYIDAILEIWNLLPLKYQNKYNHKEYKDYRGRPIDIVEVSLNGNNNVTSIEINGSVVLDSQSGLAAEKLDDTAEQIRKALFRCKK